MVATLLIGLAISVGFNLLLFLIAYYIKTDKLTDASYGLSFIILALWAALRAIHLEFYSILLLIMVGLWALRLGGFLLLRVFKAGRDKRFDGRRDNFWKFGSFWLGQAVTVWIVMLAASMALVHGGRFKTFAIIGLLIWIVGLKIETIADFQKFMFRSRPANQGQWIQSGLWRYSRHPNYFGEMCVWVGIYLYAIGNLNVGQVLVGLLSPLTIIILLRYVSGVPPLEKSADGRWGSLKAYQTYKTRTNLLIPGPEK
jgi:steroid 5-alpha reductase family enzyme